jgi:hypothetical protein
VAGQVNMMSIALGMGVVVNALSGVKVSADRLHFGKRMLSVGLISAD